MVCVSAEKCAESHHVEEPVEEVRQIVQHVDVRHRVQHGDPPHQQLPNVRFRASDVLLEQGDERLDVEGLRLGHNVFDQPVQQVRAVLHVDIHMRKQFAQTIKNLIEITQDIRSRYFRNVVE